jgi:putative glycosyltransferase (TIGR04372 family)
MKQSQQHNALSCGLVFHQKGHLDKAGACYEEALKASPKSSDALHLLGLVRAAQGRIECGIKLIEQAIQIQPNFPAALFNLGNLLRKQNRLIEAVTAYQASITLQPKCAEAHCNLGCTLDTLGRLDEAATALRHAISNNKNYAEAHRNLGLIQQKRGQWSDALTALHKAASLNPKDPDTWNDLGVALQVQGQPAAASKAFQRSTTLRPQDANSWLHLADALCACDKIDEAVMLYQKVLTLLPKSADALHFIGNTLIRSDDASLSKRNVGVLDPLYIIALNHLGSALILQGHIAEAVDAWCQTAPANSLPIKTDKQENFQFISQQRHTLQFETKERIVSFDLTTIILVTNNCTTVCAPALSLITSSLDETTALNQLDLAVLKLAGSSCAYVGPLQRQPRISLGGPRDSLKSKHHHNVVESPDQFFLFSQQLSESQYYHESLVCLRIARQLGLKSKHFDLYHGLLSAIGRSFDEALSLYLDATIACIRDAQQPVSYGSGPLPQYFLQMQPIARPDRLLREWAALGLRSGYYDAPNASSTEEIPYPPCTPSILRDEIDTNKAALLEIEVYNLLAEDLVNYHCDYAGMDKIYLLRDQCQRKLQKTLGIDECCTLFLSSDWTRNIGHIAFLGLLVSMRDLGLAPWRQITVLAREDKIANHAYLKYWSKYIAIVTDPALIARFEPLVTICGFRFATLFPFAGREPLNTSEVGNAVAARCEAAGKAALLTLEPKDRETGRLALKSLGVGSTDWFVCLHVRGTGYHLGAGQDHRNAQLTSYLPAIETITSLGGWVIRLGDASMPPLPSMKQVIDYPHTHLKSPAMDVFLCAECRFMIGMNSGLSNVPYSFGRPVIMVNWVNTGDYPPYPRNGLFLPKLIFLDHEKRLLSFRESLTAKWRALSYNVKKLEQNSARLVDNTPEEINEIVHEMLRILAGANEPTEDEKMLHTRFAALLPEPLGTARIGSAFLKAHQVLLDPEETDRPARQNTIN